MEMLLLRLKRGVAEGELLDRPDWRAIATFYITIQQGMSIQARNGASRKALPLSLTAPWRRGVASSHRSAATMRRESADWRANKNSWSNAG